MSTQLGPFKISVRELATPLFIQAAPRAVLAKQSIVSSGTGFRQVSDDEFTMI